MPEDDGSDLTYREYPSLIESIKIPTLSRNFRNDDIKKHPCITHSEQKFVEMTTLKNILAIKLRLTFEAQNGRRYTIKK